MKPLVFSLAIIQFLISTVQAKNPKSCEELNCSYCCSEINGYPECVNDILKCRYSENDNKEEIFILLYSTGAVLIGLPVLMKTLFFLIFRKVIRGKSILQFIFFSIYRVFAAVSSVISMPFMSCRMRKKKSEKKKDKMKKLFLHKASKDSKLGSKDSIKNEGSLQNEIDLKKTYRSSARSEVSRRKNSFGFVE